MIQKIAISLLVVQISSMSDEHKSEMEGEKLSDKTIAPAAESTKSTPSAGASLIKLVILGAIAFLIWKYGIPLTEKATESLSPDNDDKEKVVETETEKNSEVVATPKSDVRITPGYEAWEKDVRLQLEEWVGEGVSYKLTHIGVNTIEPIMEIKYKIMKDGFTMKDTLVLRKDGIDGRYIFVEGDKEFLVYPPLSK